MDYVLLLFFRSLETLDRDSGYTTFISWFGTSITLKQLNPCAPHPPLQETSSSSLALFTWPTNYTLRFFCTPSSFLFPGTRPSHMLTILLHIPSSNFYQFSSFLSILQYDSLLVTMTKRGTCQHFPADFPVPSSSSTTTIALSLSCQHRVNGVDTARWLDSGSWSFQSPRWSIGFIVESWLDSWALLSELIKNNLITAVFRYFGNLQRQNLHTDLCSARYTFGFISLF